MCFDSTPSEMECGQEWESPGGAVALMFMRRLLFLFWSFVFRDCSNVGYVSV
jgi:hypothetical protein